MSATTSPGETSMPPPCRMGLPLSDTCTSRAVNTGDATRSGSRDPGTVEGLSQGVQVPLHDTKVVVAVDDGLDRIEDGGDAPRIGRKGLRNGRVDERLGEDCG